MKTAIIDLGSNSARMTIWEHDAENSKKIYNKRTYVRLSEGLESDNTLKPEPCGRTISALLEFSEVIKAERCENVVAVATEAVRRAENGADFIAEVLDKTGISICVLSGDEESKYDFYASRGLIGNDDALIMDVGGGSLELIRIDKGELVAHACLPLGAVVMTDRLGNDKNEQQRYFNDAFSKLPMLSQLSERNIIGLGGSIRAMCAYITGKAENGTEISVSEFFAAYSKICVTPISELKANVAFSDRYDVAVAGLTPFFVLSNLCGADKITVSNSGVREGILWECMTRLR